MKSMKLTAGLLLVVVAAGALTLSGCANTPEDRRLRGQVIGGVTGAAVGSMFGGGSGQVIMTGAGAVLGAVVGGKMAE
jgi:outer membrane lipoprotein SlyB